MNSYTLNFKKYSYIYIIFISYAFFTLLSNIIIKYSIDNQTNKNFFIQEKRSKVKHLSLQNQKEKDYIFIGSSRTLFHISTNIFKKNNLDIYNLGISSTGITHYVYMVNRILELKRKPKNVVISISINALFNDIHVTPYIANTIDDFTYALKTKNLSIIYNTYLGWMKNTSLSSKSLRFFKDKIKKYYLQYSPIIQQEKVLSDDIYLNLDCIPFKEINNNRKIVLCTNGDGAIMKTESLPSPQYNTISLNKYNQNYIKYLKWLIQAIRKNNITPIIIFEPIRNTRYIYKLKDIKSKLNTNKIIDLSDCNLLDKLWADSTHLNVEGRKIYTNQLIKILTNK